MTTLIVKPIDMEAPGSHLERLRVLRAMRDLAAVADGTSDSAAGILAISAYVDLEDVIRPRLRTESGKPAEEVLEGLSGNDFDALFPVLLNGLLASPVPPESAVKSNAGDETTASGSPSG